MLTAMQHSTQIANLTEELARLWDEEQGQKKIRASLFSLILYVQTERVAFYHKLIKSVISKFPCRIFLIINDTSSKEAYVRTSVSSETLGESHLKIFCELIQIEVAGNLIERVPFILLPHILPDLPVYLLWTQDPSLESAVLPHLEPLADRIIFDSESTENLQGYSRAVLSLIHRFQCAIGDLNWSAISGWRTIFVQVFNHKEAFLALAQTTILRIHYNQEGAGAQRAALIEAAYLQAWLASRLNWKFLSIEMNEGNVRLTYRRPLKEVVILLIPQTLSAQQSESILSIEIESAKNQGKYLFKKHPNSSQVSVYYSEENFCQLPHHAFLSGTAEGQSIIEEIFYPSARAHYKDMLEVLAMTPWRYE